MKDPKTEAYLTKGQFAWEYNKRVSFEKIDLRTSEENPARVDRKLEQERAIKYGLDMDSGAEFPAIVLVNLEEPLGAMQYLVATGMHRIEAAKLSNHGLWFDAYIVHEADTYRREVLIRQLNALEGKGIGISEQVAHVLWLHESWPDKSLTQLAKEWGLKLSTVQQAASEQKARRRAKQLGWDLDRAKVAAKSAVSLGSIHSNVVFERAVAYTIEIPGVTIAEVRDLVSETKKARDEKTQLELVQKARSTGEARVRALRASVGKIKPSAANRVMADIKRLNGNFAKAIQELHVAALEQRVDHLLQIDAALENLKRFRSEVERVERMSKGTATSTYRIGPTPGLDREQRV